MVCIVGGAALLEDQSKFFHLEKFSLERPFFFLSLSCELPCTTNRFKTKEIFLSEEKFVDFGELFIPCTVPRGINAQCMELHSASQ